jgi:Ca2+-binding RTX toxin-like protein
VQASPSDNATAVPVGSNIVLTFNEAVKAGAGTIIVYATTASGLYYKTIQVTDTSMVTFSSNTVTVNLDYDLFPGTDFYVLVDAGAIKDLAGHSFAGITSPTTLNFTTAGGSGSDAGAYAEATGIIQVPTAIGPLLLTLTPGDESTAPTNTNIVLTFQEDVTAGSGSLEIRNSTDGSLVKSIALSDTSQVQISGNTVTVNPNVDLAPGTGYYVEVQADAVEDLAGDPFEGFGGPGFDFVTQGVQGVTLTGNGRANALVGGVGDDTIAGLGGKDMLTGAGGFDTFVYKSATESTSSGYDTITDFNAAFDRFDLSVEVTGIDSAIFVGSVGTRRFDSDLSSVVNGAHLAPHHAVLFAPSSGALVDKTLLIVDANGVAGYQPGADLVIVLGGNSVNFEGLAASNFV